jgi:hypothetical protein
VTRLTDGPTLITPRSLDRKPFHDRLEEHRAAMKSAGKTSQVHVKRESGAIVVGYARKSK